MREVGSRRRITIMMIAALLSVAGATAAAAVVADEAEALAVAVQGAQAGSILGVIAAFLAVLVAVGGVIVNRVNAIETTRRQEVGVDQWMCDLRDWASQAVDVLSETVYESDDMQDVSPGDVRGYISQLSALADRGRFFLPNQHTEEYRTDKLPAFRGFRHAALTPLVAAVNVLETMQKGEVKDELDEYVIRNRRDVIRELQKEFISHIQQILDPERRNREIARLIQRSENQVKALREGVGPGAGKLLRLVVKRLRDETN